MDKDTLINNLIANYGKYGITRAELEPIIDDCIQNYDLPLGAIYSGLREWDLHLHLMSMSISL